MMSLRWALILHIFIIKKVDLDIDTHRGMMILRDIGKAWCGDEGLEWCIFKPWFVGKPPEARKSQERIFLQVSERAWPYKQLVKLLASRTWDNKFLLFNVTQFALLCYGSPSTVKKKRHFHHGILNLQLHTLLSLYQLVPRWVQSPDSPI